MAIMRKEIRLKEQQFVCYSEEGVCRLDIVGDRGIQPCLKDEEALELAHLGVQLETHYGTPQDIEWALTEEGAFLILQCRPLKQMDIPEGAVPTPEKTGGPDVTLFEGGSTASPGAASGPVFVVRKDMDTLHFPDGAVLITAQSLPRWATVLNRAAAVVTEMGSVAGHLANVAREFGVPALFGVRGLLEGLSDGEVVTVDADARRIYPGRVEALLGRRDRPRNLMADSPVYEALEGAARHIIPLNLLNPDSPDFKPKQCKTFHDITRYCHEKVVDEMFRFGREHHFPERSSKQLFHKVPMQWWVLNLDDGFDQEVEGNLIRIDNITSIPMRAIWDGIVAFPWEGPPPIDGRGFMSVMFEATRNTALVTGVRSQYAARNYFMISRNYCNLSSRLGFHFSTIEALVSERSSENYISFQFKGGAADDQRRRRRIFLVGEILEKYGFRVEIREDHLLARLEGYAMDIMIDRLKVLGYLTMHTRQLDMIMSNDSTVQHYRVKMFSELETLLASPQRSPTGSKASPAAPGMGSGSAAADAPPGRRHAL
jgi:pyruvate,water dikinase